MKKVISIVVLILIIGGMTQGCSGVLSRGTATEPANNQILFQDDFSDPSSGWLTERDQDHVIDYENGGFRISGNHRQFDYWSIPNLNFTDVRIEVDAEKLSGPDNNSFGILCRYNHENFYGFLISSDGYYGISKRSNGDHQLIGAQGMQTSPVIRKGTTSNHIRADCIGNTLTLYINGEKLLEMNDNDYTSGDVGLLAGSFDTGGIDIKFTHFLVLKP